MADDLKVCQVCSKDELLSAIIIDEVEAERASVKLRSQLELADDRSPGRTRSPSPRRPRVPPRSAKPRIVRSVYHPQLTTKGEHPGEELLGNGVPCAFEMTLEHIHHDTEN